MLLSVFNYGSGGAALKLLEFGFVTPHKIFIHIYLDFGLVGFSLGLAFLLHNSIKAGRCSLPLISVIVFLFFQVSKSFSLYVAGVLFLFCGMAKRLKNVYSSDGKLQKVRGA